MIIVNIATYLLRYKTLINSLKSLDLSLIDIVNIYDNSGQLEYKQLPNMDNKHVIWNGADVTDRGKIEPCKIHGKDNIYFFCDDDLIYPKDYFKIMLLKIIQHKTIISSLGVQLVKLPLTKYYIHNDKTTEKKCFDFNLYQKEDAPVDICGTGVVGFDGNYFFPDFKMYSEDKMLDILFSCDAKKQGKKITCIEKPCTNWIKPIITQDSICSEMIKNDTKQVQLINKYFK